MYSGQSRSLGLTNANYYTKQLLSPEYLSWKQWDEREKSWFLVLTSQWTIILGESLAPYKINDLLGFPGGSDGEESTCNLWETWVQSLGLEDPLEEGMETHSSILAWRISWTEEPGGLQSMGSHRVGHDWSNLACMYRHEETSWRNRKGFLSWQGFGLYRRVHLSKRSKCTHEVLFHCI